MIYLGVEYGQKFTLEGPRDGGTRVNLMPVGSFESTVTNWTSINEGVLSKSTANFVNGANALQVVSKAGTSSGATSTSASTGLMIATIEGLTYTHSMYLLIPAGRKLKLFINEFTAAKSLIGAANGINEIVGTGAWQRVSVTRTASATTAFSTLRVDTTPDNATSNTFFIDSVMTNLGTILRPYFDGSTTPDASWNGTAFESATTLKTRSIAVFNDSTDPDFVGILNPESSGLDAPEIREDSNDRVESDGAIFGDFFSSKRPVVLQGTIIAESKAQRNERVGKLRAASLAKTEDATFYWEDAAAGKVFVNVRRQQALRVTKGWVKEFQLALVSADSRILSYTQQVTSGEGITQSSQEKFPGLGAESNPLGGALSWSSPENIKASDNVYATATDPVGGQNTKVLFGRKYGFTIPTTAIVVGVEFKPEAKASVASKANAGQTSGLNKEVKNFASIQQDYTEGLGAKNAGGSSNYPFTLLTTSDTTTVFGAATDMWNYFKYLTPAIINGEEFGVYHIMGTTGAVTISVDALPLKIYYAEPIKVTATNEGDAPAPALIKVKGPLENFYVLNQTTGEVLTYTGKLESTKEIWFDTENITATEHGTGITEPINRFSNVGLPNDWIRISPGPNTILVAGTGGSGATKVTIEYRYAWE